MRRDKQVPLMTHSSLSMVALIRNVLRLLEQPRYNSKDVDVN